MKTITKFTLAALAAASLLLTPTTWADHDGGDHGNNGHNDKHHGDKDHGDKNHGDATITWTKHITAFLPPEDPRFGTIAGVVGGDIGCGTVIGDAFRPVDPLDGGRITFEAEYHITGAKHSLTIRFRAIQSPDRSGVLVGVVTGGWLKGSVVTGSYQGRTCDEGVNLTCFDGTFVIKKGTKDKH